MGVLLLNRVVKGEAEWGTLSEDANLAEDTFDEASDVDLESHTPTTTLPGISPGISGWTYNSDGAAPSASDLIVDSASSRVTLGSGASVSTPFRARADTDLNDEYFRVYALFRRDSVDSTSFKAGVRVLVDGSEPEDTEKDGIDIVFERAGASTAHLYIREWVDGTEVGTKRFDVDTGGNPLSFGLSTNRDIVVEVHGRVIVVRIGDGTKVSDGSYDEELSNEVTLYSGGVVDNSYTISQDRTGKQRIGLILGGIPTSGKGSVRSLAVISLAGNTELLADSETAHEPSADLDATSEFDPSTAPEVVGVAVLDSTSEFEGDPEPVPAFAGWSVCREADVSPTWSKCR